jgi:hypothetical protein
MLFVYEVPVVTGWVVGAGSTPTARCSCGSRTRTGRAGASCACAASPTAVAVAVVVVQGRRWGQVGAEVQQQQVGQLVWGRRAWQTGWSGTRMSRSKIPGGPPCMGPGRSLPQVI